MSDPMLRELIEWLEIPSISSGGGKPQDLRRAAEWAQRHITRSGGRAEIVETERNPLVVGDLTSTDPNAPTVLIYGHYDVQSADPTSAWTSPPFEPTIRDGRLYARGAADDKGNFYPLLYVGCEMKRAGELPVNLRILLEGEEEIGGTSAAEWVEADGRGADAVIVFDGEMLDEHTPAITLGVRGIVNVRVHVRTAVRDLHSGLYGGSVLNAVHVLHSMLAEVLPGPDGRLRDELREGIVPPTDEEIASWRLLPPGDDVIAGVGGRPVAPGAGRDYYVHNWADASLDVTGIMGGDAIQKRTIVPAEAFARFAMRLAPEQDAIAMSDRLEELLRAAVPEGAEVEFEWDRADPAAFDPSSPVLQRAVTALQKASGVEPVLVRSGGSIPVLAAFAAKGIPTVLSGFTLPADNFHAPDESFRLESLRMGRDAARALYEELAGL